MEISLENLDFNLEAEKVKVTRTSFKAVVFPSNCLHEDVSKIILTEYLNHLILNVLIGNLSGLSNIHCYVNIIYHFFSSI